MVNKTRTIDFLPEIFRTHTNRQFLDASLDVLVSQPNLSRVQGFIGEKYGYGVEPGDRYVVEPTKARSDYQLDPAVVFLKPDTQVAKDFISYQGIVNSLRSEGANVSNDERLFQNEFYSWDPFVDYDKIVNYSQYYWLPYGPSAVPVFNSIVYNEATYTVSSDFEGYTFAGVSGTNPSITLLRGGTYEFVVDSGFTPLWIQSVPGVAATSTQRNILGVTNNGATGATITWVVPDKATLVQDTFYYQSGSDPLSVGIINLIEVGSENIIDVTTIVGKKNYVSPNGVTFTNGLKVTFGSNVYPSSYADQEYYVEGVGVAIQLLPVSNFIAAEKTGEVIYSPWDTTPWDVSVWSESLYVPVTPEYITVSRLSRDYNAWTRSNRWFHQDVLDVTTKALGYATNDATNVVTRAQRPIIEYRGNLQLFNSGSNFWGFVNIVDTTTTDAFSQIEGKTLAQVGTIDGLSLYDGLRIVFVNDTNPVVRSNVYIVRLVPTLVPGGEIINLVVDTSNPVEDGTNVVVLWVEGIGQAGATWWYQAATSNWFNGQKKVEVNQYPLYDIFNSEGKSLGDDSVYSGTTFAGCSLFSYTVGSGPDDPILGFPISYSSLESIGDILFTVNLNSDVFKYAVGEDVITNNVNIGFVHWYPSKGVTENLSGWILAAGPSVQYQVFEFPIIENYNYSSSNVILRVESGGSGYTVGDKLVITGDKLGGSTPENDLTFKVAQVTAGAITAISPESISGIAATLNTTYTNCDVVAVTGVGSSALVSVVIDGTGTTTFTCDILAKTTPDQTPWNPVVVYYNDNILDRSSYTVTRNTANNTTLITVATEVGVKITALLLSDGVSATAYYQTPNNLENNPFNTNVTQVAVGDLKNQYRTIFTNLPDATGQLFGSNNLHNLGSYNQYGTSIIQNSASLVLPGVFLRNPEVNLFKALQYSSEQYTIYKSLLVDLAAATDYSSATPTPAILDDIIYQISSSKGQESAFFWSDMVPSGNPYLTNTYNFNTDTATVVLPLSPVIWSVDLYTRANYRGVEVYLTRTTLGKEYVKQLLRGPDYTVSTTPDTPSITVNYPILAGDSITVKEYNQTYGSFCPSTPSKLGLYPIFQPAIVVPANTTDQYIQGHDGSLTKLWGTYTTVGDLPSFNDFRDAVLFEFECRVWNNYKVTGILPLQWDDVQPGQGRTTGYSRQEVLDIYSTQFLNWVGANRIDYKTQVYRQNNRYTWNYRQSTNKVDGLNFQQGYWKGIYQWLYDTVDPAGAPWGMLGFVNKPDWWESRYGAAPYTSGNTYMWNEIAEGYVWNGGDPYINTKRIRPYLLSVLPVDSYGQLLNPFVVAVSNYNGLTFNSDWIVGDGAPVENIYSTSSTWPFDLLRILALTKPAKFFNLFADMDDYKYTSTVLTPGQYLYNGRYHLDPRTLQVYGGGIAKHSYINWIVDYNYQRGADGNLVVSTLLSNLDVRLTYNMAGFTSKNYLKFLVEKATPNSRNTSLLIPDENYAVLLYDNPPEERITYSSIIVQKLESGYAIYGNGKNKTYFVTAVPKPGNYKKLTVGGTTVQVAAEWYGDKTTTIPYGTTYYTVAAVAQFILNYGQQLTRQGVMFTNIEGGVQFNWIRMAEEFISWTNQGWETGSVVALNPNARYFSLDRPGLVPQPLTLHGSNFVLNENLLPIPNSNLCIDRQGTGLNLKVLSPADTVAYGNFNLASIEHAIVFDNSTSFGDTIYNLETGLRQSRLLLQGYKTADWSGYIDTSGFILNENNVKEWQPNTKYPKGIIVTFKTKYYTAVKLIEPAATFSTQDWLETDYSSIKTGLLPNPSTEAYESLYYYDTTRANLENDADLLSFSLIGFRPRDYMAAADLSDITQVNVYQNITRLKGTRQLAESFRGAKFDQGLIDYQIQENWAIKIGDFGAILNTNYVEARLDQGLLTGNPTLIGFAAPETSVPGVQQSIPVNTLVNWERPPLTENFLPAKPGSYAEWVGLPTAGYVNSGDVQFQAYTFGDLNTVVSDIGSIYAGSYVWLANHSGSWGIYEAVSLENQIVGLQNNLNGTVTLATENIHGLTKDDLVAIVNFDPRVDGFYVVRSTPTLYTLLVTLPLDSSVKSISSTGVGFKLLSRRFEQASDAAGIVVAGSEWNTNRVWVDYAVNQQWAVWFRSTAYKQSKVRTGTGLYGISSAASPEVGTIVSDGAGILYRYWGTSSVQAINSSASGTGLQIVVVGDTVYCSSPADGRVYIYKLNTLTGLLATLQTINPTPGLTNVTGAIAVSSDGLWLYIADSGTQKISVWNLNTLTGLYSFATLLTDGAVPPAAGWGKSISTTVDGSRLVVGAPYETVGGSANAGATYIYNRRTQRYYGDGITTNFTLINSSPLNVGYVYVNDILQTTTATIVGTTVTVTVANPSAPPPTVPPPDGSVIAVSTAYFEPLQKVLGPWPTRTPEVGALFGVSVATNRYGAEVIVGSPYDMEQITSVVSPEGSVWRYTNGGQRYGTVSTTVVGSLTGYIFVNGWYVYYSGGVTAIRDAINIQTPTNIIATTSGSTLTITVREDTPGVIYNLVDITGPAANLSSLGITPYTFTQTIKNVSGSTTGAFGGGVAMDEQDSLLVAALNEPYRNPTTFDYVDDCRQNDTYFDQGTTVWIDTFSERGVVSLFNYLPAYNESVANPGKYGFGQYISTPDIADGTPAPRFGYSLWFKDNTILVSTPAWSTSGGGYAAYTADWSPAGSCPAPRPTAWYTDKAPVPAVDIYAVNNINLYNATTNTTLEWLDYIDPVQGKVLSAVATNIDYRSSIDPAVYNAGSVSWTWDHIGETWLDLTTIRYLNYYQPDLSYNARNWGAAFPGSTADIYTWIESTTPPISYSGSGFPLNFDQFTSATAVDNQTNSLVTKYYFWVKNYDMVPQGKTLSPLTCSAYLLSPLSSGISFMAPVTLNVVGLYNSSEYIQTNTSVLHLGYGIPGAGDQKHTSWSLLRAGDAGDFLPGLPSVLGSEPAGLYLKFIESFTGRSTNDQTDIPDPRLPLLARYGTSFRPQQSMFIDRFTALKNYIAYANSILILYPITEIKDLSYLEKFSSTYDVRRYWKRVNWWSTGYSDATKPVLEVASVNDLQTILENQLLISVGGVNIQLEDGLVVKVTSNNYGKSEYYIYSQQEVAWNRIGAELSTIQFIPQLWNPYGWGSEPWGQVWDKNLSQEIYWVIRWLNEQCYTGELALEKNNSLLLMFNYIQSESLQDNNYLPWLNKTSLVDVKHRIRSLLPYKKYQRDNQEFLEGFLNEVKPYHVLIKDFVYSYDGVDTWAGNLTDFDLPAAYSTEWNRFITPQLAYGTPVPPYEYGPESVVWQDKQYNQWFSNTGLSITSGGLSNVFVGSVAVEFNSTATTITLESVTGLPANGILQIELETLGYSSIDLFSNTVSGVTRGLNGSVPTVHPAGSKVYSTIPGVVVYDTGRGYTVPPIITPYIDTTVWPEPLEEAVLTPVMALDKLIGVSIDNPGKGYATAPEIIIQPSPVTATCASSGFNVSTGVITLTGHPFQSGDSVTYTAGDSTTAPLGLIDGGQYWVRVLSANTIALYQNYYNALLVGPQPYEHVATDDGRVKIVTAGSGLNHTFTVSAKVGVYTNNTPIRGFNTTIKFDRVTYNYTPQWTPGGYYSAQLPAVPVPTPTPTEIALTISSVPLSTSTATVDFASYTGKILPSQLSGQKCKFVGPGGIVRWYWIRAVTDTTFQVWADPFYTVSVPPLTFPFTAGNSVYLPYPVDLSTSMAVYGGAVYKCVVANNDLVWDPAKWVEVEASAADRIGRYYEPTASMPGKDLPQLLDGVQYPNSAFLSPYANWELTTVLAYPATETLLESYNFTNTPTPGPYNVQDDTFTAGYGPEELVAGVVYDFLKITVTSNDITPNWTHTVEVDNFGGPRILTNTGSVAPKALWDQWWYGTPGTDPLTDPTAAGPLSTNAGPNAVILRS